jgi:hypothetical protein
VVVTKPTLREGGRRVPTGSGSRRPLSGPYAIIIAVFVICQIPVVKRLLDKATYVVK